MSGLQVADGKGTGELWEIKNHRGQVDAGTETAFERASRGGLAFSWTNVTYAHDAADTIIAVRNTSSTRKLHIVRAHFSSDTVQVAVFHITRGSAALAGTAITGVNFGTQATIADADAKGDETTNSSQGNIVSRYEMLAATQATENFEGAVILGTSDSFALDYPTNAAIVYATFWGYYE